jgi:hypothetical protein
MTCDQARELIGANPDDASPELLAHLSTCAGCQAYREQMLALNAKIRRALELDWSKMQRAAPPSAPPTASVTPTAASGGSPAATPTTDAGRRTATDRSNVTVLGRRPAAPSASKGSRPRLFAVAASLAAALITALTLWLSRPADTLAAEVVKHVEGEPGSWHKTQPVAAYELDAVLRKSGVKLGPEMPSVVYASSCFFRGRYVPHLVVMTQEGPVTVMILENEKVPKAQQFNEDGYSGLLVPAPTGSVAVLSRTPMSLERSASSVVRALQSAQGET